MVFVILALIFWFSLLALFYAYAGYPLCTFYLAKIHKQSVKKEKLQLSVTVLIAAYQEEECIAATLENKLALDYPQDQLEIIVVSDESQDSTDAVVQSFADSGVMLLRQSPRAGKTSALNLAVPFAHGEILVFSDANSIYAPNALRHLVANFADPNVGYVTGKMIYTDLCGTPIGDGCSAYMNYENLLRQFETSLGSVVGVDGGIDAMRKNLYSALHVDQLPDFVQPLKVVEKGYRVVYEPEALLKENSLKDTVDEYRMRVRVSLRALWALWDMRQLLWGKGGVLFAWQLWSHKVLRYLCFIFLIVLYLTNLALWSVHLLYKFILISQTACYVGAALYPYFEKRKRTVRVLYFLHYFVLLNMAAGHATIKFLLGKKQVLWTPRKG